VQLLNILDKLIKDMNRIKNIEEIILSDFDILVELIEPVKSGIIKPESMNFEASDDSYAEIKRVGSGITKYSIGDIIMKFNKQANGFLYKDRKFLLVPSSSISIAVKANNFDPKIVSMKKMSVKKGNNIAS
jgi:hypothetical protein